MDLVDPNKCYYHYRCRNEITGLYCYQCDYSLGMQETYCYYIAWILTFEYTKPLYFRTVNDLTDYLGSIVTKDNSYLHVSITNQYLPFTEYLRKVAG